MTFTLDSLASSALFIFIPFLLLKRNIPLAFLGILTSTFFLGNMFGKVLLGRMVDKFKNVNVFIISEIIMAIFVLIMANSLFLPVIIISSVILGIFTKGTFPVLITMVSESVEHHGRFEKAFGLNALFTGIGSTLAPLILGLAADRMGIIAAFNFSVLFALMATSTALMYKFIK